mmetsp:Transcript_31214/g.65116  ORF Transcript_31214/g.65116 Transcript_31214/m.65116 type:complete len:84 (-) Transcript_31214:2697-2948(-)
MPSSWTSTVSEDGSSLLMAMWMSQFLTQEIQVVRQIVIVINKTYQYQSIHPSLAGASRLNYRLLQLQTMVCSDERQGNPQVRS